MSQEDYDMARPAKNGNYVVPDSILILRPDTINCTVKAIPTMTKKKGLVIHYYVYERLCKVNSTTGKKTYSSGECLGKIEDGMFCPNKRGRLLLQESQPAGNKVKESVSPKKQGPNVEYTSDQIRKNSSVSEDEVNTLKEIVSNMNLDLEDIDLQLKDYGEYALVLACTKSVLEQLNQYFSVKDARLIYALSVIYFIEEYTPASYVKDIFDQSILSNKWPTLAISENQVGHFLKLLGRHPAQCDRYCQGVIDQSSGFTAIDGHVILTCSRQNDLADYGNKYQKIGNKQLNILEAYDVNNNTVIASKAYEGGLLDKVSVQDLLSVYSFPSKTTFLVDMGFYSEEDMGLYRESGRHFVIPVPDHAAISKAIRDSISFTQSFIYEKTDENGLNHNDTILYKETTVREMEDFYQAKLEEEAKRKTLEAAAKCKPGEKAKKSYPRKIVRSAYGDDRLIQYRDEEMHHKMVNEFRSQLGMDEQHTEEQLAKLAPKFGVIVLRTNLDKENFPAELVYKAYKKRWKIETHYNFVANTIKFCGLHTDDYCSMQGLSFLILTVGQIKAAVVKKMRASSKYVSHLSIKECIVKAARIKLSQHMDKTWHITVTTKRHADLLKEMDVDMASDLKKLNEGSY